MKKLLALLLVLVTVLSCPLSLGAMAEETEYQEPEVLTPEYSIITSIHSAFFISKGVIQMSGTVSSGSLGTYAYVKITLQKKAAGTDWKDVKSWSATGTASATKIATYTPESGVFYRLKVYGYVSNDTGSESDSYTTSAIAL